MPGCVPGVLSVRHLFELKCVQHHGICRWCRGLWLGAPLMSCFGSHFMHAHAAHGMDTLSANAHDDYIAITFTRVLLRAKSMPPQCWMC